MIHVPVFPSMEVAAAYAVKHQPFKAMTEDFQHRDDYRKLYGPKCADLAQQCWEAAQKGDQSLLWRKSRELSRALPPHLFDYQRKERK